MRRGDLERQIRGELPDARRGVVSAWAGLAGRVVVALALAGIGVAGAVWVARLTGEWAFIVGLPAIMAMIWLVSTHPAIERFLERGDIQRREALSRYYDVRERLDDMHTYRKLS